MKTISISVEKRKDVGKKSTKDLRRADHVPCVMYGGAEVLHFHAHENDFRGLVYTPNVYIVELEISGVKKRAIMQALQFHPTTDKINHIDFVEVFDDKPVTVNIPIDLQGSAIGIKEGGKSRTKRRTLKVKGLIANLPDTLTIDVSDINIGHVIKVGDLKYPNLEMLDPSQSMVFAVVSSRLAKGMEEGEDEGTETVEAEETPEGGEAAPEEAATEE